LIRSVRPGVYGELSRTERMLAFVLASASGAAILAHVLLGVPMAFSVPFLALPFSLLLAGVVLWKRARFGRLHRVSALVIRGAFWGVLATLAYDVVRPLLKLVFEYPFSPFAAIPAFGHYITGRPRDDPVAIAMGWVYHVWNGVSFAVMFTVLKPAGGITAGVLWAMLLQALMMAIYPEFLKIRLDHPGFLATGIVGHAFWGIVLGWGVKHDARKRS
jgi:hypothetical protein